MSDLLKITKTEGKATTLHLEGHLSGQTEKEFLDAARAEFESGKKSLLLDFSNLQMITSAGLRALHIIYKMYTPAEEIEAWAAEHKQETFKSPYLKIAQPSSEIRYILSISGFSQSMEIYPTLQEALASLS